MDYKNDFEAFLRKKEVKVNLAKSIVLALEQLISNQIKKDQAISPNQALDIINTVLNDSNKLADIILLEAA